MDILHEIRTLCADAAFREEIVDLLERLCAIDTAPGDDLARLRENERPRIRGHPLRPGGPAPPRRFDRPEGSVPSDPEPSGVFAALLRNRLSRRGLSGTEQPALSSSIGKPRPAGVGTALNAHIDTVPPFFPPSRAGDFLSGRGTADDKGNVAAIIGALQVLAELERRGIVRLQNKLTAMFVIDEETGGNGSLALAMDRELKARYDSILVLECTGNRLHPANRGAVFIKCEGRLADADDLGQATPSLLEAFALAILALLDEGEAIRQESDHPLFPHRPVQTCTGILGPFGVHPSAICGEVAFELVFHVDDGTREHGECHAERVDESRSATARLQRSISAARPRPFAGGSLRPTSSARPAQGDKPWYAGNRATRS